jgi:hypothetical protein
MECDAAMSLPPVTYTVFLKAIMVECRCLVSTLDIFESVNGKYSQQRNRLYTLDNVPLLF